MNSEAPHCAVFSTFVLFLLLGSKFFLKTTQVEALDRYNIKMDPKHIWLGSLDLTELAHDLTHSRPWYSHYK
jgi:hypothetical protein